LIIVGGGKDLKQRNKLHKLDFVLKMGVGHQKLGEKGLRINGREISRGDTAVDRIKGQPERKKKTNESVATILSPSVLVRGKNDGSSTKSEEEWT